jgi:hypothetical protein
MSVGNANKIAFIIPYFGSLPKFFKLFTSSVTGKSFEVLFFSDLAKPNNLPENVKWIPLSFTEAKDKFNEKIGVEVLLNNTYKLCDLKPTLGLVFNEYIKNYEFWGSIDIDLVVGDFEKFITPEILKDIDFYSGVKAYVSGSMFIVRNNDYCNNLFRKSKDYVLALASEQYLGFDECGGNFFKQLAAGESIFNLKTDIQSFTEVLFMEKQHGLKILFTDTILEPKGFDYVEIRENGIYYHNKEYLILHFIYLKTKYYFNIYPEIHLPTYFINSLGNFNKALPKLSVVFSRNFAHAVKRKIQINLRKIKISVL